MLLVEHFTPLQVLKEVLASKATLIVLDCGKEIMSTVLQQIQQVGMATSEYFYILSSLDTHTVDMENFKYGGTNFTTLRLVNTNSHEVQAVIRNIVKSEMNQGNQLQFVDGDVLNLDTDTALIYDSVTLFALSLDQLHRVQDLNIVQLDCSGQMSWDHGSSLINYMKLVEFTVCFFFHANYNISEVYPLISGFEWKYCF